MTEAYRRAREIDRRVLALYFDAGGKLRDFAYYGLTDGNIVAIVQRTTETQGRELSFIEQMFGNFGRFGGDANVPSGL